MRPSFATDYVKENKYAMVFIIVPFIALIAFFLWIIFVPVYLSVNTQQGWYQIYQRGTACVSVHPCEDRWLSIRAFGITWRPSLKGDTVKRASSGSRVTQGKAKSAQGWFYLIRGIYRSIRLLRLNCTVDFDDPAFNARMIPVMWLISGRAVNAKINFQQQYSLDLLVQVRLNKILWTFIRFVTKK